MGNKKCSPSTQNRMDNHSNSVCNDGITGNKYGIYSTIKYVLDELLKEVQTIYNVTQYEIAGDGITDDAPKIQELIDLTVADGGGTIFFPAGTYKCNTYLDRRLADNIHIIGEGIDETIFDFSTVNPAAPHGILYAGDYCRSEGFTLLGSGAAGSYGMFLGNTTDPTKGFVAKNIKVKDWDFGIVGQDGEDLILQNIYSENNINAGIGLGGFKNAVVDSIYGDGDQDWTLYIARPWINRAYNNHVSNVHVKNSGGYGVHITYAECSSFTNFYLEGCSVDRNDSAYFGGCSECSISNIYIKDSIGGGVGGAFNAGKGIKLNDLIGCTVGSIRVENSKYDGFEMWNNKNCSFSNLESHIAGNRGFAVFPAEGCSYINMKAARSGGHDWDGSSYNNCTLVNFTSDVGNYSNIRLTDDTLNIIGGTGSYPSRFKAVEKLKAYGNITNGVAAAKAEGTLTFTGMPVVGETFVINATTITFVSSLTWYNQVVIGADLAETVDNIEQYFNIYSDESYYGYVEAISNGVDEVKFRVKHAGAFGNAYVLTEALTNCTADGGGTFGGTTVGADAAVNFLLKADGEIKIKKVSLSGGGASTPPVPSAEDMMLMWTDTDDSKVYMVINIGGVAKKTLFA